MKGNKRIRRRTGSTLGLVLAAILLATMSGTGAAPGQASAAPNHLPITPVDTHVTTPREFFGYDIGDDYKITPWQTRNVQGEGLRRGIVDYAYELRDTSPRVQVFQYGASEDGRPMILSVITSPQNWAQMANLKGILNKLADPRQIRSDTEAELLVSQGKAVYWMTAAIHASERTSPEVLTRLAYHLAADQDPWTLHLLDNVIVVIDHSVNPDGLDWVTDWYYKYKGTNYEDSSPPYYNKYINHDNNRDYLGLGMRETQQNAAVRKEWNPTLFHDLHQAMVMLYMSPGPDPNNEAFSPITVGEWLGLAGHTMSGLIGKGWKGIYTYDYASMWYPGFMNSYTSEYNSNAIFYELQGARYGSPRSMTSAGRPRTWYNPQPITVPFTWRLIDAVNLEDDALRLSLGYMADNKNELLYNFYLKGKMNMATANSAPPYAYVIPQDGGDNADVTDMINNLRAHLFEISRASVPFQANGRQFQAGDYILQTNQPYGLLLKNLLSVQVYPPNASSFDVTAWTYGMLRDVETVPVSTSLASLPMIPLTTAVDYAGSFSGGASTYYVMEHGSNNNLSKALPVLWGDSDFEVKQADDALTAGGQTYPAGTFIIKTGNTVTDTDKLSDLAHQYGLMIRAVSEDLDGAGMSLQLPKVAIYTPNSSTGNTMPEGWVRMLLDRTGFPYSRLYPTNTITSTVTGFDVIVVPDVSANGLVNGQSSSSLPPEYRSGIGKGGVAALKTFVEGGGTLLTLGRASAMPIQQGWPVSATLPSSALAGLARADALQAAEDIDPDFPPMTAEAQAEALKAAHVPTAPTLSCPGTIVRLQIDAGTKVGYGYSHDEAAWCDSSTVYYAPAPGSTSTVVATYPAFGPLLLSGWINNGDLAAGKAAIVDAPLGNGRVILMGLNVLYRAQATGTYMLFWNALFEGGRQPTD